MNKDLLMRAFEKRSIFFNDGSNTAFRLFNGSGDGFDGLTVDYYSGFVLAQTYLAFDDRVRDELLSDLSAVLTGSSFLPVKGLIYKNRVKNGDVNNGDFWKSVSFYGEFPAEDLEVLHMGMTVSVDIVNSQNTGLFMDMRDIRSSMLKYYPEIKNVLNLFSYTSVFSVHALVNGVSHAVNIDISSHVLKRSKKNYMLNGLNVDDRDFIRDDTGKFLRYCLKKNTKYDLIIFDPPTFSRNKKSSFSVNRDYSEYLKMMDVIASGGFALTAINSYSVERDEFLSLHPSGWKMVFFGKEASDFPSAQKSYLKAALWKIDGKK